MVLANMFNVTLFLIGTILIGACGEGDVSSSEEQERGNIKTVEIGDQIWMAENLNVSHFRNGDSIPEVKTNEKWEMALESSKPAWCYYNNDPANGKKYGKLYNWYAVDDPRGLAPEGWHIPTEEEWNNLEEYLSEGDWELHDLGNYSAYGNAGTKMKSTTGWGENGNGTNESGFSGRPGSLRLGSGKFEVGYNGFWWSSTEHITYRVYGLLLEGDNAIMHTIHDSKKGGSYSVRCLKGEVSLKELGNISSSEEQESGEIKTIKIGNQVWMAENLNVRHFRNGDSIPNVKTNKEWEIAHNTDQPAWCYYDNQGVLGEKFGKLYNWYAVDDPRGLAPEGWHIPTEEEWKDLGDYLGSNVGAKMKSTKGWETDIGTNESGFQVFQAVTAKPIGTLVVMRLITTVIGGVQQNIVKDMPGVSTCFTSVLRTHI